MPSPLIANKIQDSLAPGETYEDFAYMFDALFSRRGFYNFNIDTNEQVTGRLICIVFPDKPDPYIKAMGLFRMQFAGIANNIDLQVDFSSRIKTEALTVRSTENIIWDADRYFETAAETLAFSEL